MAFDGTEELQLLLGEEAPQGENGVQGGGAVAFGQDKTVPVGVVGMGGVHPHGVEVQHGQQVHGGQRAADVAGIGRVHHVNRQKPGPGRQDLQLMDARLFQQDHPFMSIVGKNAVLLV